MSKQIGKLMYLCDCGMPKDCLIIADKTVIYTGVCVCGKKWNYFIKHDAKHEIISTDFDNDFQIVYDMKGFHE